MQVQSLIQAHRCTGVAYPVLFYCSRNAQEVERSDPEQVMRCLLRQVSHIPDGPALHPSLRQRFEERRIDGHLSIEEATQLFLNIIQTRSITYVFVDAIDECCRENRHELLQAFQTVLTRCQSLIKIFVTSREDRDLVLGLGHYSSISVDARNNQHDIRWYVAVQVEALIEQKRLLGEHNIESELKQLIERRLIEGAQGM